MKSFSSLSSGQLQLKTSTISLSTRCGNQLAPAIYLRFLPDIQSGVLTSQSNDLQTVNLRKTLGMPRRVLASRWTQSIRLLQSIVFRYMKSVPMLHHQSKSRILIIYWCESIKKVTTYISFIINNGDLSRVWELHYASNSYVKFTFRRCSKPHMFTLEKKEG